MNKVYLAVNTLLACSVLCVGQTDRSGGDRVRLTSGTSLQAELQNTLDINNAKVGDNVVLKVTKSIKLHGDVILPKGTTRIGRVTDVQKRAKGSSTSRLGSIFDRRQRRDMSAQWRGGHDVADGGNSNKRGFPNRGIGDWNGRPYAERRSNSNSLSGSAHPSTTLSSQNKNMRVEKGANLQTKSKQSSLRAGIEFAETGAKLLIWGSPPIMCSISIQSGH